MAVEVEAAGGYVAHFSNSDSQSDKPTSVLQRPFPRKKILDKLKSEVFMVMNREDPSRRVPRAVAEFTAGGQKCVNRLIAQVELRLAPYATPEQNMVVFLDPLTKEFATNIFTEEQIGVIVTELKRVHRNWFRLTNKGAGVSLEASKVEEMLEPDGVKNEKDEGCVDDADVFPMDDADDWELQVDFDSDFGEESESYEKRADAEVDRWLNFRPVWNKYKYDGEKRQLPANSRFNALLECFDTMKYFRVEGKTHFPSFWMMARVFLSKFDSSAFQERVFSIAGNAMNKNQTRMNSDLLENRTLLCQNKYLIKRGLIPMLTEREYSESF